MRSPRFSWLLASALVLIACGGDDDDNPSNPQSAGGSAGRSTGGTGGSGIPADCKPRCSSAARACGVSSSEADKLCAQLCTSLTLSQLTCLEKSSCDALNDGSALVDCNIQVGAGGAGQGGTAGQNDGGKAGTTSGGQGGTSAGQGGAAGSAENTVAACNDGVDNDGDKFTDCNDKDCCAVRPDCQTTAPTSYCGTHPATGGAGGTSAGAGGSSAGTGGTSAGANAGGSSAGTSSGGTSAGGSGQGGSGTSGQGGAPTMTDGDPNRILLKGTVLVPAGPIVGSVLVEGEKITCVEAGDGCASQAAGATVIETNGIISPGLIDMHNHILYDIFDNDDWAPTKLYTNHNQWTSASNEPRYPAMGDVKQCFENASQGKPSWCPAKWNTAATSLKCEMNKWGETKAIVAGTTSVVGLIGQISGCIGSLARSLGTTSNDLPENTMQSSALVPSDATSASNVCKNFVSGSTKSYVVHVGEGLPTDTTAKGEYEKVRNLTTPKGCLMAPQTTITHGVAFGEAEFTEMGQKGMKLVWSPQSNISLYGATADIPTARAKGVTIALGPDWSMGGSVNMLNELRFADQWDNDHWNNILSPRDIFEMATVNAAKAAALDDQLGSIKVGLYADLFVFGGDASAPYNALLATTPSTVRLTMVGGRVLYGDLPLKASSLTPDSWEESAVCAGGKFICVAESNSSNKLDQTFGTIKGTLEDGLAEIDAIPAATKGNDYKFAPLAPLTTCP